jgi:hypothetical protein
VFAYFCLSDAKNGCFSHASILTDSSINNYPKFLHVLVYLIVDN